MLRELQEGSSIFRNCIDIAEERVMLTSSDFSCFILSCSHKISFFAILYGYAPVSRTGDYPLSIYKNG